MNAKSIAVCAVVITACVVAGIIVRRNHPAQKNSENSPTIAQTPTVEHSLIKPRFPQLIKNNFAVSNAPIAKAEPQPDASAVASAQKPPAREPLQDPIARDALALVGSDPEAELYWLEAINDLSLPANERQDLIEDLNEEGLPDPKHPTPEDLPLILNRLAIIEIVGPDAADEVNADAFIEAYKDLLNLAELAMGGGEPVN